MRRCFLLIIAVLLLPASLAAQEKDRLRLLGAFSHSLSLGSAAHFAGDYFDDPITDQSGVTGGGIRYIFFNGVGIGISHYSYTLAIQHVFNSSSVPTELGDLDLAGVPFLTDKIGAELTFFDLSFTVGEELTFTPGTGVLIRHAESQSIDAYDPLQATVAAAGGTLNDAVTDPDLSAFSIFLEFGYELSGFELVAGMYIIQLQFKYDEAETAALGSTFSGQTIQRLDRGGVDPSIIVNYAGLGYTF